MQLNSCANLGATEHCSRLSFSQGEVMSLRKAFGPFLALCALTFLVACGGGNGNPAPGNPTPPPTGSLTNSELKGTYVFSISGVDASNQPYAMAGTFAANGAGNACSTKGAITAGTFDINDFADFNPPAAGIQITGGNYCVQSDGRGQLTITTNVGQGFPNLTFDFVLQDNTHGLITEFDTFGSGSGTIDLQSATSIGAGSYAFLISGDTSSGTAFATAGNFTVGAGGAITAGAADCNDGAAAFYANEPLSGTVVAASSSAPATTLTASSCTGQAFDVFPIDSTHMKIIQMDSTASQSGDIFSQSAPAMPVGTLAFTLQGLVATTGAPFAAGGFLVTDSTGDLANTSTEDFNEGGTLSPASPQAFSGTYTATTGNTGRFTLGGFTGFTGGSSYAAYPSSGGVLLLELDTAGLTSGAAFTQTPSASFATGVGYGLNLSGTNLGMSTGTVSEVDDIAEFTATSSGTAISGLIDENSTVGGASTYGQPFDGTYTLIGGGRGQILAPPANSTTGLDTLNGDLDLLFYTVDGTTFPFMEYDAGQVATGVFVQQSATTSSATAHAHALFVPHPLVHPHTARQKKQ